MRILLVEDNRRFGALMVEHLADHGHVVDHAATADDFRELALTYAHDLYIVDLGLPDGDGIDLIAELRSVGCTKPVLVVTARGGIEDRVRGLDQGADDYLVKPFNYQELLARIRALSRRPAAVEPDRIEAGDVVFDRTTGEFFRSGRRIDLRPSERRLLALMISRSGRLVSRATIEGALQCVGGERSPNAVDKLVSRLRRTLREADARIAVKTIKGAGYVLDEAS